MNIEAKMTKTRSPRRMVDQSSWEQLAEFTIFLESVSNDEAIRCLGTRAIIDDRDLLFRKQFCEEDDGDRSSDDESDVEYKSKVYKQPLMQFDPEFEQDLDVSSS